eukprot:gnl/Trimastix_PCT/2454.p1 GENE.gnl/Trimastix_PCT/2454~~gnl/Trimastix_PCT/2454.p1  ORF type:complete len:996 (+),score=362.35 gnl/Trimastix_PCT/2454:36-3023(+)
MAEDLAILAQILKNALSPVEQVRTQAAAQLEPVQPAHLLRLIVQGGDHGTLLQASIQMKRKLYQLYNNMEENQKVILRSNIIEAIMTTQGTVRTQLGLCLHTMATFDFPDHWPQLLPSILENMRADNPQRLWGSVFCLLYLYKRFEYKLKKMRAPFHVVVEQTLPLLLQLGQSITAQLGAPDAAWDPVMGDLMKMICKIFYTAIHLAIPPFIQQEANLMPWIQLFGHFLTLPIPENRQPIAEQRPQLSWWRAKKWAANSFERLFTRFAIPEVDKEYKAFSRMFRAKYSVPITQAFLTVLWWKPHGTYCTDRVINIAMSYMTCAITQKATFQVVREHFTPLLRDVMFPLMCFTDFDMCQWKDDPMEYLRRSFDIFEDFHSPKLAASNLLMEITKKRPKHTLQPVVLFLHEILEQHARAAPQEKDHRRKEGALYALGVICDMLKVTSPYREACETLLLNHVLPEFQSPEGFLRARACWIYGQFSDVPMTQPERFTQAIQCVLQCLNDTEIPVRIQAALAIRYLLNDDNAVALLRPHIPALLQAYFMLMNECCNEDLLSALESLIEKYDEEMKPHAVQMGTQFATHFLRLSACDDDDDQSAMAAFACLSALGTLLSTVKRHGDVFIQMEQVMLPIFSKFIAIDKMEFLAEVLQLLGSYTFYTPQLSPQMWSIFEHLLQSLQTFANEYIEECLGPLDNFITRDTETFLKNPLYHQFLFNLCQEFLKEEAPTYLMLVSELIKSLILATKGRIDDMLPQWINLVWKCFQENHESNTTKFKVLFLEIFNAALYNSPVVFVQHCSQVGILQPLFGFWFQHIDKYTRIFDKKLLLVSLCSLLQHPDIVPPFVREQLPHVVTALLGIAKELTILVQKKSEVTNPTEENFVETLLKEEITDEAEHAAEALDQAPLPLPPHGAVSQGDAADDSDSDGDTDDESYDDELEDDEDEVIVTPIDGIDEVVLLAETLRAPVEAIFAQLNAESQQLFQQITAEAARRKQSPA